MVIFRGLHSLKTLVLCFLVLTTASCTSEGSPIELMMATAENKSLHWGTYKPGHYVSLRTRSHNSLQVGLMWFGAEDLEKWKNARYTCDMEHKLKYGYEAHDGRTFSVQNIEDPDLGLSMKVSLLKEENAEGKAHNWVQRIEGDNNKWVSLIYFVYNEANDRLSATKLQDGSIRITGDTEDLGTFEHYIVDAEPSDDSITILNAFHFDPKHFPKLKDAMMGAVVNFARKKLENLDEGEFQPPPHMLLQFPDHESPNDNFIVVQKFYRYDFKLDFVQKHGIVEDEVKSFKDSPASEIVKDFDSKLKDRMKTFDTKFEQAFGLKSKGFDDEMISNAKSIFSDVLGGIGYFYGDSVVDVAPYELDESSDDEKKEEIDELEALLNFGKEEQASSSQNDVQPEIIHTKPMHLFTATPSRPFFPRGFFWDEGFHQTIIAPFDSGLILQMVTSWFNLMDKNGWIAREQILGEEARGRVPEQFQVQYPHYANPPTLVIPLAFLANHMAFSKEQVVFQNNEEILFTGGNKVLGESDRNAGKEALKKAQLKSLYSNLKKNFEWYQKTQRSIAAKEATLFRWRGRTDSHCLPSGLDDYPRQGPVSENDVHMDLLSWVGFYAKTLQEIANLLNCQDDSNRFEAIVKDIQSSLIKYHWSEEEGLFCDAVIKNGKNEHFCHAGYLSLFPFVHGLVDINSVQVKKFLNLMSDPEQLWTDYGLRSLSQQDEFYGKKENYWRGPIWVNINYLVLRSLKKYYMVEECKHKAQASEIYKNLRENLIKNIMSEYQRTSFVWEQYDQNDGKGKRSHPFTGWSALIVNILAEIY